MAGKKVVVIGSGPAGYVAAIRASQLGAGTVLVEKSFSGGVCLNSGCMPTKSLIASARAMEIAVNGEKYGLKTAGVSADIEKIRARKDAAVSGLRKGVEYLLKKNGVRVIKGTGVFREKGRVEVKTGENGREKLSADAVIICTGSSPALPDVFKYDGETVITSNEALELKKIPRTLLIAGAGAIGLEFACIYSAFGAKVFVVEMMGQVVPGEDGEAAGILQKSLENRGIEIITGDGVESLSVRGAGDVSAVLRSGRKIDAEMCLAAVGRRPMAEGVEAGGVDFDEKGFICVNERMQTSMEDVYAAGDIAGGWLLAHKGSAEGAAAAENICGLDSVMDYRSMPRCVYTIPEMAGAGLSEEEAQRQGYRVKTGKFPFSASGKAVVEGETEGMVKFVAEEETGEILGVQIVGLHATELISEAVLAMNLEAVSEDVARAVHPHPTLSECLMEAARAAEGRCIHF